MTQHPYYIAEWWRQFISENMRLWLCKTCPHAPIVDNTLWLPSLCCPRATQASPLRSIRGYVVCWRYHILPPRGIFGKLRRIRFWWYILLFVSCRWLHHVTYIPLRTYQPFHHKDQHELFKIIDSWRDIVFALFKIFKQIPMMFFSFWIGQTKLF